MHLKNSKLFQMITLLGIVFLLFWIFTSGGTKHTFHLRMSGMSNLAVDQVVVSEGNVDSVFTVDSSSWDVIRGHDIEVSSQNSAGVIQLKLVLANGEVLQLSEMEYKVGKFNYITEYGGKLKYVKAHWQ